MTTDSYVACLKYHKETKLMICSGTMKHLSLVDEIIDMATNGRVTNSQLIRVQKLGSQVEKLQKEIKSLKAINSKQERTIKALLQKIEAPNQPVKIK